MELASRLFRGDRVIWIIFMFLCLISAVVVFSATSTIAYKNANFWAPITRHGTFLIIGLFCMLFLHNVPYRFFSILILLLPVSVVLLILTMLFGETVNNAQRSLVLFGVEFQPLEFAKLSSIVFVAFMLSKKERFTEKTTFKWILCGVFMVCASILTQNFSTAFLLFVVCYIMMIIGELSFKRIMKLTGFLIGGAALFLLMLLHLPDSLTKHVDRFATWKARIERFVAPKEGHTEGSTFRVTDENYQVVHSNIAIARGGVLGQMPGHGQQRDFLPQAYSDFIYAIILEELGFLGGMFVLFLYIVLLIRVGMIARKCESQFAKYLVLSCGLLIVIQAFANMAVAVGLIPVTGQPLPLISRGGTSTIMSCVYFGIILSVSRFGAGMGDEEKALDEETEEIEVEESDVEEALEITTVIPEEKA